MTDAFWHAFIPLFVAIDVVGILPLFWGMAERLSPAQRRQAATEAALTALTVAIAFLLVSQFVFVLLGLRIADLMVAGGVVLIVLSLRDLLFPDQPPQGNIVSPGVVPLGVPLLTGPAVLATVLLVRDRHGWPMTMAALGANVALVWLVMLGAGWLMQRLGREGAQVISKISSLVLTAYGVMLIRQGLTLMLAPSAAGGGP
jgi:multiple antibiotic resistance protein